MRDDGLRRAHERAGLSNSQSDCGSGLDARRGRFRRLCARCGREENQRVDVRVRQRDRRGDACIRYHDRRSARRERLTVARSEGIGARVPAGGRRVLPVIRRCVAGHVHAGHAGHPGVRLAGLRDNITPADARDCLRRQRELEEQGQGKERGEAAEPVHARILHRGGRSCPSFVAQGVWDRPSVSTFYRLVRRGCGALGRETPWCKLV